MRCARHPSVETDLSCGRCGTSICPRCMVHAEVGIRCQTCSPPPKFWERRNFLAGSGSFIVIALIVLFVVWQFSGSSGPQGFSGDLPEGFDPSDFQPEVIPLRQDAATPPAGGYRLAITNASCGRIANVTVCEGAVQNISDAPIEDITVVIELLLENGEPGAIDSGPLEFNPLLAGQETLWALQASHNPAFKEFRLSFRAGDEIIPARPPR